MPPQMAGQKEILNAQRVDDFDHIFGQLHLLIGFDIQRALTVAKTAQIRSNHPPLRIQKFRHAFPAIRAFRPPVQHNHWKSIRIAPIPDMKGSP